MQVVSPFFVSAIKLKNKKRPPDIVWRSFRILSRRTLRLGLYQPQVPIVLKFYLQYSEERGPTMRLMASSAELHSKEVSSSRSQERQ